MLKFCISLIMIISIQFGYSQTAQTPNFFAQCLLDISTDEQADELSTILRENPYVQVARVDWPTKRVFILTKDISHFTETNFNSWLGVFSSSATCIQIGLHGTDRVNPYPFTNCND